MDDRETDTQQLGDEIIDDEDREPGDEYGARKP